MSLAKYNKKRDFKKTHEPKGNVDAARLNRFVIQKHAASRLHYDFRLEMAGTLKSWAVPKGIPYKKGEKHLAVEVEDHPVSYKHFEGTIPKGQYGGGTVMVWDLGHYEPLTEHPLKDLAAGKLHFVLHGEKLQGEWYLVRLRDEKNWLLVRGREDMQPISKELDNSSAVSGRTMEAIGRTDEVWNSSRPEKEPTVSVKRSSSNEPLPKFVEPMKARLVARPPAGKWIYEIKFDGFRALAFKNGKAARLLSRNDKDFGRRFPGILQAVEVLDAEDLILDGEIVALDKEGKSSFQLLQAYNLGREKAAVNPLALSLLDITKRTSYYALEKLGPGSMTPYYGPSQHVSNRCRFRLVPLRIFRKKGLVAMGRASPPQRCAVAIGLIQCSFARLNIRSGRETESCVTPFFSDCERIRRLRKLFGKR